jgi:hypothetical protein
MGGLVAKQYIYNHAAQQGVNVRQVISLGTPHEGTKMGVIAKFLKPAKQMGYQSPFVLDLQEKAARDSNCDFHAVSTQVDAVVMPNISEERVKGNVPVSVNRLEATGHVGFLFSDASAEYILEKVKAVKESAPAA